jgi:methyl-accepting chemotaxis protein
MFAKLSIRQIMYLQFVAVLLPVALVLGYQTWSDLAASRQLNRRFEVYDLTVRANDSYKTFLNGVTDAVDTGKLGGSALAAIKDTGSLARQIESLDSPALDAGTRLQLESLSQTLQRDASLPALSTAKEAIRELDQALVRAFTKQQQELRTVLRATAQATHNQALAVGSIALGVIGLSIIFIRNLVQSVNVPLGEAIAVAHDIAEGNLNRKIKIRRDNELSQLLKALAAMRERLKHLIARIHTTAADINAASSGMVANNTELSARTEAQASTLEQTAAGIEQLTATVDENAANAQRGKQLAESSVADAERSGAEVGRVVEMMNTINASAKQIVEIVSMMDSIAFQTNILALNAAVESARAAEHGRGFAVVAGEVRNLAQRSAAAAKQIKALIAESVERIESGTKLANEAGRSMNATVQSIQQVAQLISAIAGASTEQSQGIAQLNHAVAQLDSTTQQNASFLERAAAIAIHLDEHAKGLAGAVSVFDLGAHTALSEAERSEGETPPTSKQRALKQTPLLRERRNTLPNR